MSPRPRTPATARARGFTLLELLIVVVVLGMIAGVAAMSAGGGSTQRVELAAMQVTDTVERARALAVAQRKAHGVVFDVNKDRFAVIDADGNMVIDSTTQKPFLVTFTTPDQPQGIDIAAAAFGATEATAVFDAQGVPVAGGAVLLRHGNASVTLTLDAATGRMQ